MSDAPITDEMWIEKLEQCIALLKAIHDGYPHNIEVPAWIAERVRAAPVDEGRGRG
jgi:hypothetical protein